MKLLIAESQHDDKISAEFWEQYKAEVRKAYHEVSKLLPFGSEHVNFFVQPRTYNLIESTGDNAYTHNSEFIELAFDPTLGKTGLHKILNGVKFGVYHEMSHAARFNIPIYHVTFLDHCIFEGLATVFSRDQAGEKAPWADYPDEVTDWIQEIIDLNDEFVWASYKFNHPDGRKWISYKIGTYIVDEAMKNSGKSIVELTQLECTTILDLAKIDISNYKSL